jgi:uncharacterized protein YbcC (UPF0753/DUF2309 family)
MRSYVSHDLKLPERKCHFHDTRQGTLYLPNDGQATLHQVPLQDLAAPKVFPLLFIHGDLLTLQGSAAETAFRGENHHNSRKALCLDSTHDR